MSIISQMLFVEFLSENPFFYSVHIAYKIDVHKTSYGFLLSGPDIYMIHILVS